MVNNCINNYLITAVMRATKKMHRIMAMEDLTYLGLRGGHSEGLSIFFFFGKVIFKQHMLRKCTYKLTEFQFFHL